MDNRIFSLSTTSLQSEVLYRWALRMTIDGDVRFFSHHDLQRAMDRIVRRSGLNVRYSHGFNPRPYVSLPVPRPVGVCSQDERVLLTLDEATSGEEIIARLNEQAPKGMTFVSAQSIRKGQCNLPEAVRYSKTLTAEELRLVQPRLDELLAQEQWIVERRNKVKRRGRRGSEPPKTKSVNLRPRIATLQIEGNELHFTCIEDNGAWARPNEILSLVGLPQPEQVATLVRVEIIDDISPQPEQLRTS